MEPKIVTFRLETRESRPTSSDVMTASQFVQKALFWQLVRQKRLDGTRRTIDHSNYSPTNQWRPLFNNMSKWNNRNKSGNSDENENREVKDATLFRADIHFSHFSN